MDNGLVFVLATGLVTVYVFQEPSLLSSLQDNGLTDVVLHALLVKDVCLDLTNCADEWLPLFCLFPECCLCLLK